MINELHAGVIYTHKPRQACQIYRWASKQRATSMKKVKCEPALTSKQNLTKTCRYNCIVRVGCFTPDYLNAENSRRLPRKKSVWKHKAPSGKTPSTACPIIPF